MTDYFNREFYRSDEWKQARRSRLILDNYTCTKCETKSGLQVHHVIPITKGGSPTAMFNLRTLCEEHHNKEHPHLYNSKNLPKATFKPTRIRRSY